MKSYSLGKIKKIIEQETGKKTVVNILLPFFINDKTNNFSVIKGMDKNLAKVTILIGNKRFDKAKICFMAEFDENQKIKNDSKLKYELVCINAGIPHIKLIVVNKKNIDDVLIKEKDLLKASKNYKILSKVCERIKKEEVLV